MYIVHRCRCSLRTCSLQSTSTSTCVHNYFYLHTYLPNLAASRLAGYSVKEKPLGFQAPGSNTKSAVTVDQLVWYAWSPCPSVAPQPFLYPQHITCIEFKPPFCGQRLFCWWPDQLSLLMTAPSNWGLPLWQYHTDTAYSRRTPVVACEHWSLLRVLLHEPPGRSGH